MAEDLDGTKPKISIQLVHEILSHVDKERTRLAEKFLRYKLISSTLKPCEACAAGKENQKNVTKSSDHSPANDNWGVILLDISTINRLKYIKVSITKSY